MKTAKMIVTKAEHEIAQRDHADKIALLAALEGLMAYTGGWDAPADHPCGIARDTIAKIKTCVS